MNILGLVMMKIKNEKNKEWQTAVVMKQEKVQNVCPSFSLGIERLAFSHLRQINSITSFFDAHQPL